LARILFLQALEELGQVSQLGPADGNHCFGLHGWPAVRVAGVGANPPVAQRLGLKGVIESSPKRSWWELLEVRVKAIELIPLPVQQPPIVFGQNSEPEEMVLELLLAMVKRKSI